MVPSLCSKVVSFCVRKRVVALVELVGGPGQLQEKPSVFQRWCPNGYSSVIVAWLGLGQSRPLVFQQGQQQARADAVVMGDILDDLGPAAVGVGHVVRVILQPAGLVVDKFLRVKVNLRRPVDEQAVGKDLVGRAPQRQVIDRDLHRHARRHGGGRGGMKVLAARISWTVVLKRRARPGSVSPGLSGIVDQLARRVARPGRVHRPAGPGRPNRLSVRRSWGGATAVASATWMAAAGWQALSTER